jgi:murein DD-endopeptidase MepM/ murein hydrolase activator NlpD
MKRYKFDRDQLKLKEVRVSIWGYIKRGVVILVSVVVLSILYYAVFAIFFNTEKEKDYLMENRVYEKEYEQMKDKVELVDQVINNLTIRDQEIYEDIFNAKPQLLSMMYDKNELDLIDTTSLEVIGRYTANSLDKLTTKSDICDEYLREISDIIKDSLFLVDHIPSISPIKNFSVMQTGASIGKKIHPFYKTLNEHNGIDLITTTGTSVLATANGVVDNVKKSKTDQGNVIVIDHGNGYMTTYAHLSDILVRKGSVVKQGSIIGRVGVSGKTFAPHLHYEVIKDNKYQDPINYFFAELSPISYREMLMIALNTGQSLD